MRSYALYRVPILVLNVFQVNGSPTVDPNPEPREVKQ